MFDEELARHTRRKKRIFTGILAIVGILAIAVTVFFTAYITDYRIEGSHYVQEEEIIDEIFSTPMEQRFLYALFRSLTNTQKQVNGLESYEVKFSPDLSVTVSVTENPIVGAVNWEDSLYYFDRYGFIMAQDIDLQETVPVVEGTGFENICLYEYLESEQSGLAEDMLQLTQLLADNGITVDAICYDEKRQVTVMFGEVKVSLGSRDNMTDKIAELCAILENGYLSGLKGTLHLENYKEGSGSSYIFDRE